MKKTEVIIGTEYAHARGQRIWGTPARIKITGPAETKDVAKEMGYGKKRTAFFPAVEIDTDGREVKVPDVEARNLHMTWEAWAEQNDAARRRADASKTMKRDNLRRRIAQVVALVPVFEAAGEPVVAGSTYGIAEPTARYMASLGLHVFLTGDDDTSPINRNFALVAPQADTLIRFIGNDNTRKVELDADFLLRVLGA